MNSLKITGCWKDKKQPNSLKSEVCKSYKLNKILSLVKVKISADNLYFGCKKILFNKELFPVPFFDFKKIQEPFFKVKVIFVIEKFSNFKFPFLISNFIIILSKWSF